MTTNAETIARLNRAAGFTNSPSGAPLSPSGQGSLRQAPPIPNAIPQNLPRGLPDPRQSLPLPTTPTPVAPTNIPSSLGSRFGGAATALSNGAARASGALIVGASLASAAQNPSTRNLVDAGLDVASVVAFSIPNPISQAVGWALQGGKLLFNIFTPPENTAQKFGNDTPPPFTGGQGVGTFYDISVSAFVITANGTQIPLTKNNILQFRPKLVGAIQSIYFTPVSISFGSNFITYRSTLMAVDAQGIKSIDGFEFAHNYSLSAGSSGQIPQFTSIQLIRVGGATDNGLNAPPLATAPIAPAPNNTGQPNFDLQGINDKLDSLNNAVTGLSSGLGTIEAGIQGLRLPQANNGMPMARPNYVPQPLLNPNEKLNPKIEETPQDKPSFKPLFNPFENGAIPSFEAGPFISGVSNPDDQFNPRDSKTGLTREEFDQRILEERQKTRDKQEANRIAAKKNDDKINQQLNPQLKPNLNPQNPIQPSRTPDIKKIDDPLKTNQNSPVGTPLPSVNPRNNPNFINLIDRFKPPTDCQFSCSNLANCFVDVTVDIFDGCDPKSGQPKNRQITIQVLPKEKARTEAAFKELLEIRSSECSTKTAIATFPDSWAGKIVDDRPQASVYYREWDGLKFGKYTHTVSIPFYSKPKGFKPSLPMIKKGSFFGILILKDNSQIHVNCESIAEAKRVVNALKQFCGGRARGAKGRYGEVVDGSMKKVTTKAVRLDFYSKGRQNCIPDWSVDL